MIYYISEGLKGFFPNSKHVYLLMATKSPTQCAFNARAFNPSFFFLYIPISLPYIENRDTRK